MLFAVHVLAVFAHWDSHRDRVDGDGDGRGGGAEPRGHRAAGKDSNFAPFGPISSLPMNDFLQFY